MATGANLQAGRGIQTTALTPMPETDNGEAAMWASLGRLADQIGERAKPGLLRRAEQRGKEDAAAVLGGGERPRALLPFGDAYEAREAAFGQAYIAGRSNDFDEVEAATRNEHSHNLPAYEEAMRGVVSDFIAKSEPSYAVDIEDYARRRVSAGREAVAGAAQRVAIQEANVEIGTRQGLLTTQLIELTRDGKFNSPEYAALKAEREQLIRSRLDNPAIVYTPAEAEKDEREFVVGSVAALHTRNAIDVLRAEGPDAALASLQEILTDGDLRSEERQTAFEQARAAVTQEIDLAADRQNIAAANRTRAENEIKRRIEDDAAAIEIGAGPTDLSEAEVMAVLGPSGVAEWRRKQAEASQRNRLTGSLVGLPRDEAIARAMQGLEGAEGGVVDLNDPLKTPEDFDALAAAIRQVETGNNPARVSEAGAIGAMQLLPDTAREMAQLEGVPYDENRLLNDVDYNMRLGRRYLTTLLDRYDGNQMLASAAYHAGPALVDAWLKPRGVLTPVRLNGRTVQAAGRGDPRTGEISVNDWLDSIAEGNPRSAAYPRSVARAMGSGRQSAEWRETQAAAMVTNATQGFASDPLNFAAQHRLAALPPLTVDAVFQGGDAAAAWAEGLRARQALGSQLADSRGAPQRFLTNGEVAAYRDRIERNPGDAITLARAATRAIGGRGARDLLAEIGQGDVASTAIHIADIAATGGDGRFADAAANGLNLRASGTEMSSEKRDDVTAEINRWQSLLGQTPSLLAAVRNSAMAAALSDETNGIVRPPEYYAQAALGRTRYGANQFGGAAEVNGAKVIIPRWMNSERFDDAIEVLADGWASNGTGPVFGNGDPMPARIIARLRPVRQPNGNYRLQDQHGATALRRDGRPFEVNMDAARVVIGQRLGAGAVRPD